MIAATDSDENQLFLYRITCHEQEKSLCSMEMRALWGVSFTSASSTQLLLTERYQPVNRSPFVKYGLQVWCSADSLSNMEQMVLELPKLDQTFKIIALDEQHNDEVTPLSYDRRRAIEREIGSKLKGKVDFDFPECLVGIVLIENEWYLGKLSYHEPIWQRHNEKPRQYSTALSTKVARAIVNIAVPSLQHKATLYDPCCGIGTVLMEACSQAITSAGSDINPLAVVGARENMVAFQYDCPIQIKNIVDIYEQHDVAILDLPYNLCSVLPVEERTEMLIALRRISKRFVVVSVDPIADYLFSLGYMVEDQAAVEKMKFRRHVYVCS